MRVFALIYSEVFLAWILEGLFFENLWCYFTAEASKECSVVPDHFPWLIEQSIPLLLWHLHDPDEEIRTLFFQNGIGRSSPDSDTNTANIIKILML